MINIKIVRFLTLLSILVVGIWGTASVVAQDCRNALGRPIPCTPTPVPPDSAPEPTRSVPDRDGDGVADIVDRCPDQGGPAQNNGCPEDVPPDTSIPTVQPTATLVSVTFPTDGKCWVGNESSFNVNRRKYPSLNAPITGQLLPGQIARAVGNYTDPDGLKWYSLAIFADPNSNAYIVDWVASSVVIATPGCTLRRAEALELAGQYGGNDWEFVIAPVQIQPPKGVFQLCDGIPTVTYIGDILDCDDNPIPEPFDGMTSQFYCDSVMMRFDELSNCPGADSIIIINGMLVFPAGINMHPPNPGKQGIEDDMMPILNTPALLMLGSQGEPMEGEDEPPMPMLVAMGIRSGLSDVAFNPQPEPPAGDPYDFSSNPLMFNPQPEPPASPFDLAGESGWIAMQLVDPTNPEWQSWMQSYELPDNEQGVAGFWLVGFAGGDGMTQTALIPMMSDDLSWYGFNPQPEPPPLFLPVSDGYQLYPHYQGVNLPDINIVGFNPQPEPPASPDINIVGFNPQPEPPARLGLNILTPDEVVRYDASVDYSTVRLAVEAVLVPLGDGKTFMNMLTSYIVVCPHTDAVMSEGNTMPAPACVEFIPTFE